MFHYFQDLKLSHSFLVVFFLFNPTDTLALSDNNNSKYIKDYNNITPWTVWKKRRTQSVEYRLYNDGPHIEIKSKVTLKSSLSGVLLFLQDTSNIQKWLHNASESKILTFLSARENISQIKFHAFWPMKDREMIIQSRFWQNEDLSINVSSKDVIEEYRQHFSRGVIPINIFYSHWHITPQPEGLITIEYSVVADPNGIVPRWLTSRVALNASWKTLTNISQQLPSSPLQRQTLPHIKEP